jgi:hypothetical protein
MGGRQQVTSAGDVGLVDRHDHIGHESSQHAARAQGKLSGRLVVVDTLAESSGHLLYDDWFMANHLGAAFQEVLLVSSPSSIAYSRARELHNAILYRAAFLHGKSASRWPYRIKTIARALGVRAKSSDTVLFQSFEEVSAYLFTLLHPQVDVHLVITNNLGNIAGKRLKLKLLSRLLPRASGIYVHCTYEKELIGRLLPKVSQNRIHVVGFQKYGIQRNVAPRESREDIISYLGGGRTDQGIEALVALYEGDQLAGFTLNVSTYAAAAPGVKSIKDRPDVKINTSFLSDDAFIEEFDRSAYVVLPYDKAYEGKTSGILCDAITTGTPIIAPNFAPFSSLFEEYGAFGFLVDFETGQGFPSHADLTDEVAYRTFQINMRQIVVDNSPEAIACQFHHAFSVQNLLRLNEIAN